MSFTISYKGTSSRGTNYLYRCPVCCHEQEENHPASETPLIRCAKCGHCMNKKPTALNLDADMHDSGKSHNIGWDTE